MKVAYYNFNKGVPEIEEVPVPKISDGEILIKAMAVGVCGTELITSHLAVSKSFGHELAGIVCKVGNGIKNLKEGDRVFVHHRVVCFNCHYCRRGVYTMCPKYKNFGFDPGGYAEYVRVKADNVKYDTIKLPEHISFDEGCLIEPLACAWNAVNRSNIKVGDTVLIIGAGFEGLAALQIAKIFGAGLVIISDFIDFKLEIAKNVGADIVINPGKEDIIEKLKKVNSDYKADVVMIMPSNILTLEEGMRLVERGGTITQFGIPEESESVKIFPANFVHSEYNYVGSFSSSPIDTHAVANFLFNGKIKVLPLISHRFKLEQIEKAFELKKKATDSLKIIIHPHLK